MLQTSERPCLRKENRKEKRGKKCKVDGTEGTTQTDLWPPRVPRKQWVSCANRGHEQKTTVFFWLWGSQNLWEGLKIDWAPGKNIFDDWVLVEILHDDNRRQHRGGLDSTDVKGQIQDSQEGIGVAVTM